MSQQPAPGETPQSDTSALNITGADKKPTEQQPAKKLFFLNDVKRVIEVPIHWPAVYPDHEPWVFKFRLALSKEAEEARQTWVGLPASEANEETRYRSEIVAQICDLLTELPTGFGDLEDEKYQGKNPSVAFKQFFDSVTDPEQKLTLFRICEEAWNGYWRKAMPSAFRPPIQNSRP